MVVVVVMVVVCWRQPCRRRHWWCLWPSVGGGHYRVDIVVVVMAGVDGRGGWN